MSDTYLSEEFSRSRRWYLVLRLAMFFFSLVLTVWAWVEYPQVVNAPVAAVALFLFAVTSALAIRITGMPAYRSGTTLLWFAVPDLVSVAMLGLAFIDHLDPAYSLLFALATLYGAFVRHPSTWVVGLAAVFVYLGIHAFMVSIAALEYSLVVQNAVVLFVSSFIIHKTSLSLAHREEEKRQDHQKVERLNASLQNRVTELRAIAQIGAVLHSDLDFDRTGPIAVEILSKIINVRACCLFVIDKSESKTIFSASIGIADSSIRMPQLDATLLDSWDHLDDHFSCMPLLDYSNMMVVFCADAQVIDEMSEADRIVLEAVANQLVVAVENSQLYKLTKRMAITDELTGLHNYRHLQHRLDEELRRASRYEKDLSFLMIDVDDFKAYNDTNGHVAGDRALRELGEVVVSVVREVDIVCRYGGEEFSVILPETDVSGALVTAAKIREAVGQHVFGEAPDICGGKLTISIGLATYPTHADDKQALLTVADDALYRAKNSGKNRIRSPLSRRAEIGLE